MYSKVLTLLQILYLCAGFSERSLADGNVTLPTPVGKSDLNLSKIVGDWYSDRYICTMDPFKAADPVVCGHVRISNDDDKLTIRISLLRNSGNTSEFVAVVKQKTPGVFECISSAGHNVTFVETDYDNYLTVVVFVNNGFLVCIDRRNQAEPLPQGVIDKVYKTLETSKVDVSKFALTDKTKQC